MALILKSNVAGNSNAPFLPRDLGLNKGTLFLVDALSTFSWAPQRTPLDGETLFNLTEVAPNAVWDVQPGQMNFAGGFVNNGTGVVCTAEFGNVWMPANNDGLIIIWYKAPASLSAGRDLIAKSSSINTGVFNLYVATDGNPRVLVAGSNNNNTQAVPEMSTPPSTIVQLAIATNFAQNNARLYKNGALVKTITCESAWPVTTDILKIGPVEGTWYRAKVDNLTLSELNPTALVAADYSQNSGRFS